MHHVNQIHTIQIVKKHHYELRLRLLRVLREARKNTPPPMQKQGMWPGCGQGVSKWLRMTYNVNLCGFIFIFMSNNSHESGQKT